MKYPLSEKQIFHYRPKPFFFITTSDDADLTLEKTEESLRQLKACGFGGFVLFNKAYTEENYLGQGWFSMVRNFAIAAKKLKLAMWINDGFDFPPGNVAGKVEKIAPELKQQRVRMKDGQLCVETVDWGFPAFEHKRSGELFVELVYEEYKKQVGEFFGNPIVGFFSDADNRRIFPDVMYSKDAPAWDYFPWTDDFAESFAAAYGYDILPYMQRVLDRENCQYSRDYWEHAGRLYHRWFENNHAWLQKHHLLYTGHTSDSSPFLYHHAPRSSCFSEGRFSDLERHFDYPGTDQEMLAIDTGKHLRIESMYQPHAIWGQPLAVRMTDYFDMKWDTRAKQAASTAYMYGKKGVMCEMFAASNYGVSPAELKQISTFQLMQGVTFVVPHAWHYRFNGDIKYFAPPEFSGRGMIGRSIKQLNDELAELTYMMEKGEAVYPVALLDPTDKVWMNDFEEEKFFSAFAQLNRLPYGYVICDAEKILNGSVKFRAVVAAGIELDAAQVANFAKKGIAVLDETRLDELKELIACDVSYNGTGTPHYMRKIIDGEEFCFVANVENAEPVTGTLYAYGKEKEICLYPGDVIYISRNYDSIPEVEKAGEWMAQLPQELEVTFERPNLLQMEWFEGGTAKTEEGNLIFPFACADRLPGLKLYIPKCDILTGVSVDKKPLSGAETKVYDDTYLVYDLPALKPGQHRLVVEKNGVFHDYDRILLEGEFDADIQAGTQPHKTVLNLYNLKVSIPEKAEIKLSKRRSTLLTNKSWAGQGQIFYSGEVSYTWNILAEDGTYRLILPRVRDVIALEVDGKTVQTLSRPPYALRFSVAQGIHTLKLRVSNSLGNQMECYAEESGILAGGYVEKI
ncbi:MAG: hypothetical protein E7447_01355 [Ruminococcaceae bacterium]|nr:hypothetical protein [Oscillospiraceae bacterium]